MPWCSSCDRFLSPSTVHADGTCPTCGRAVDPGWAHAAGPEAPTEAGPDVEREPVLNLYGEPVDLDGDEKLPLPWHLKLLAGALAVYLGYRFLQGIEWVFGK
jgi:hypothetical protein